MNLPHRLDRSIVIRARRDTVFSFFTDSSRWASWWGAGSTIEAKPGGQVFIRHPNGIEAVGEVLEVAAGERIVFTYGFVSGKPMAPGSSRVTIHLEPQADGTRVVLAHEFAEAGPRDEHAQGWRYQLSLFANAVSTIAQAHAAERVDRWFGTWSDADADSRARTFAAVAVPAVRFRDQFSAVDGANELVPHIGAAQRFMPGMRLERHGDLRQCQGTALADWVARGPDGQERANGTNVFLFNADGLIEAVTGFWGAIKR
jgi:uncharacterized protein YndB with AHSA1/START domain